jgi:hypothetical protein
MFHVQVPAKPPAPVITPGTPPSTPATPTVPTVPEKQVKILKGGWWCLILGIILLAATFTLVPLTTRKYAGGTAALLIALWPVSEFLSWLVPYLPYIGGVILIGGLVAVITLLWKRIRKFVCSVEALHSQPNWATEGGIRDTLSKEQDDPTKAIVAKVTEAAKCDTNGKG